MEETNYSTPSSDPSAFDRFDNGINGAPTPNATAVLALGIASIPTCFCYGVVGLTLGIIALVLASKGTAAYKSSPGSFTPSSYNNLKAGRICAIIGVAFSAIYLIFTVIALVFVGSYSEFPWEQFQN